MLAVLRVVGQDPVAQVRAAEHHRDHAGAGVQENAQRRARLHEARRQDALHGLHSVHQGQENEGGRQDHAGLEPAAGAVVAVKVDVQRERDDERRQRLGAHPEDQLLPHSVPSPDGAGLSRRRAPPISRSIAPTAAANTTVVSPMVS